MTETLVYVARATAALHRMLGSQANDRDLRAELAKAPEGDIRDFRRCLGFALEVVLPRSELDAKQEAASEADTLLRELGLDPQRFRTEGGSIIASKVRAAILHPSDYSGLYLQPPAIESCDWKYDDDDIAPKWDTACGKSWAFVYEGPVENGVRFCHGCGKKVSLLPAPTDKGEL